MKLAGINIAASTAVPAGSALLIAPTSAEDRRRMRGMTLPAQLGYLVGRGRIVLIRNIGGGR